MRNGWDIVDSNLENTGNVNQINRKWITSWGLAVPSEERFCFARFKNIDTIHKMFNKFDSVQEI